VVFAFQYAHGQNDTGIQYIFDKLLKFFQLFQPVFCDCTPLVYNTPCADLLYAYVICMLIMS
jgi:hypothetical protein